MIKDYWLIIGGNWFTGYNGSACVTSIDAHSLHENEETAGIAFKKVAPDLYGANLVHLQLDTETGSLKLIPASEYETWKQSLNTVNPQS